MGIFRTGIAAAVAALCILSSCDGGHFITDRSFRKEVEKDFAQRKALFQQADEDNGLFAFSEDRSLTKAESEAMRFLYAYMPLADICDYPSDFYLEAVRNTFRTREEMSWGNDVPELLFRHFVLPLRVNNENLDSARMVFSRELKPRVKDMSMKEAILEVNHWCHEKMTYEPSDARTSSPLASLRTATGRCGEESTFTVTALRSAGIPARQVYTPRWAHTDDNHAWVEAWADGEWWFLGACEPEPILNLGWFNAPASRALLMHNKAFGRYEGPEEVVLRSPNYTEINLIGNYASTARADVTVLSAEGTPVEGARVDFMIYNYAEFYPALAKYTDAEGRTFLTAGLGDMLAWASSDGKYGFEKISFGRDTEVTIVLDHDGTLDGVESGIFDIVPPPENVVLPEVSAQMRAENDRRFAYEDSLRLAYTDTFLDAAEARDFASANGLAPEAADFLVKARGNHKVISDFLCSTRDQRGLELLGTLSWKDLRDITPEVLLDSYEAAGSILSPRVENEFLSPYKGVFLNEMPQELQACFQPSGPYDCDRAVTDIVSWIGDNILLDSTPLSWKIPITPVGVWHSRVCDPPSRDVFFVALARTFGIDSRKDAVTGKIQYRASEDDTWKDVSFGEFSQTQSPKGTLILNHDGEPANPEYYTHFTISKIADGRTSLLSFDEGQVDMGGGMSYNSFRYGVELDEGEYILVSGLRNSDGSVPVSVRLFDLHDGEKLILPLEIRSFEETPALVGEFRLQTEFMPERGDDTISIGAAAAGKSFVLAVLGVGEEPTNHVLRDIAVCKAQFDALGCPVILLCTSDEQLGRLRSDIDAGRYGKLPSTTILGIVTDVPPTSSVSRGIIGEFATLGLQTERLPLVAACTADGSVYSTSQGYTIGLGTRLAALLKRL